MRASRRHGKGRGQSDLKGRVEVAASWRVLHRRATATKAEALGELVKRHVAIFFGHLVPTVSAHLQSRALRVGLKAQLRKCKSQRMVSATLADACQKGCTGRSKLLADVAAPMSRSGTPLSPFSKLDSSVESQRMATADGGSANLHEGPAHTPQSERLFSNSVFRRQVHLLSNLVFAALLMRPPSQVTGYW